jgi:hypothetical protein
MSPPGDGSNAERTKRKLQQAASTKQPGRQEATGETNPLVRAVEILQQTAGNQVASELVRRLNSSGIPMARPPDPRSAARQSDGDDDKRGATAAQSTVVQAQKQGDQILYEFSKTKPQVITGNDAIGLAGEVQVPFHLYSNGDWSYFASGEATKSSRMSIARQTRHSKEPRSGFDFLVENQKTHRLVIGENKASRNQKKNTFDKATATTENLETNLKHTIDTLNAKLQEHAQPGAEKLHPDAEAGFKRTITKLQATLDAVQKQTELPEGVVFELTSVGGHKHRIGPDFIRRLAQDPKGKGSKLKPEFVEHLLSRTFIRNPELAQANAEARGEVPKGERRKGEVGTDTDPDIVPAKEAMTEAAHLELQRIRGGTSTREWKGKQKAEKKAEEERQKKAAKEAREKARAEKKARKEQERQEAKAADEKRKAGDMALPPEERKRVRKERAEQRNKDKEARKEAAKQEKEAAGQKITEVVPTEHAQQQQAPKENAAQEHAPQEHAPQEHSPQKPFTGTRTEKVAAVADKATEAANQLAGAVRGMDAFEEARKQNKGLLESSALGAKAYLENTNVVMGAIANAEAKQKDGQDSVEAWISTMAETGAGYMVPGGRVDQAINAADNLYGAVDDHMKRHDPPKSKDAPADARLLADTATQLTPSRMFSTLVGAGARAYYNIGKAIAGDTRGVDKFADDMVQGKLSPVLQPIAMLADFAGNLGSGQGASKALDKTLAKAKDSALSKIGDKSGDLMYELGQSDAAKSGKYGLNAMAASITLSVTSDMIAGKSFSKAVEHSTEPARQIVHNVVSEIKTEASEIKAEAKEVYRDTKADAVDAYQDVKAVAREAYENKKAEAKQAYQDAKRKLVDAFTW